MCGPSPLRRRAAQYLDHQHGQAQRAPELHADEFSHAADFAEHRNRVGGLLLLPRSFNASYGDLTYEEKLPRYSTHNALARSLHLQTYEHNPGLVRFVQESSLPFKPRAHFTKSDLEPRSLLYRQLAERIRNPEDLLREVDA